jgi:hypothetical protein
MAKKVSAGAVVKDIQLMSRETYSAEERIRIVPAGPRGESLATERAR